MTKHTEISTDPIWVIVDGERHHVSEYAHLKPKDRPIATCPVCEKEVTMKLGTKRAHHYAHQPPAQCILTNPESVLHYNTKIYLADFLEDASHIMIHVECANYTCNRILHHRLFADWNRVEVEYPIGPYLADVAFLRDDKVVGVIEVLVTHAMEDEKVDYFIKHRIPWLELPATEEFLNAQHHLKPWLPLPYVRAYSINNEKCPSCLQAEKEKQRRKEQEQEYLDKLLQRRKRNEEKNRKLIKNMRRQRQEDWENFKKELEKPIRGEKSDNMRRRAKSHPNGYISALSIIDYYSKTGERHRYYYMIVRIYEGERWIKAQLANHLGHILFSISGNPITKSHLDEINNRLDKIIKRTQVKHKAFSDITLPWESVKEQYFTDSQFYDFDHPPRYSWDGKQWEERAD